MSIVRGAPMSAPPNDHEPGTSSEKLHRQGEVQVLRPGTGPSAGDPAMHPSRYPVPHPPANRRGSLPGKASHASHHHAHQTPPPAKGSVAASALGFVLAAMAGGGIVWASGCGNGAPPGPSAEATARATALPPPVTSAKHAPIASATALASAIASAAPSSSAQAEDKPYNGPMLGALGLTTIVYPKPEYGKKMLGYVRLGGKVPVDPTPVKDTTGKCNPGWYHLVDGGYVCGRYGTLDLKDPKVRLGVTPAAISDVLPYKYAYNNAHGTPLYHQIPSRDDMLKYEPYLAEAKRKKREKEKEKDEAEASSVPSDDKAAALSKADAAELLDGGAAPVDEEDKKPWWQKTFEKGKAPKVKLDDLAEDADSTLAKRMVKGFFIAVDKTFAWHGRSWYKTTGGLVAPADRMYLVKPPATQGLEFPAGAKQVGFILSGKGGSKYEFDADKKKVSVAGSVPKFTPFGLTGEEHEHKGATYRKTVDGWWMKASEGTLTDPGPKPSDLAAGEKWIDVNLSKKTLVAFDGDKPYYAALIAPGKKSKDKQKDHATIQGTFRIREKHIAVTMDGDGRVASDLPYSIEDVPYVQYFEGSYALHGAFWHNNFGHEMSHGCVNLSPLDAKKIFYWSEPQLPRGWHAAWSTAEHRGTLVVIHE